MNCRPAPFSILDLAVALAILAAGLIFDWCVPQAEAQCLPGVQCQNRSISGSVGMLGRATTWSDGSVSLRGGLGGANMRIGTEPVIHTSPVLPVFFGSDPTPAAGVYVGIIEGHGITLTCWHAAKHGVRAVGPERPKSVTKDKYGYDMAAVMTRPLDVPVAILGPEASRGDAISIIGYPSGRYGKHSGRVDGYFEVDDGQTWPDLKINVPSSDGDSGGGVFNSAGQLVGLLWGTAADRSQSSAAVSAPAIADFLRRIRICLGGEEVATPLPGSSSIDTAPDIAGHLDDFESLLIGTGASILALQDMARDNAEAIAALAAVASVPGPRGPQGPPGEDGEQGPPAKPPTMDYDKLAVEVLNRLPPFYVRHVDEVTGRETIEAISLNEGFTIYDRAPE